MIKLLSLVFPSSLLLLTSLLTSCGQTQTQNSNNPSAKAQGDETEFKDIDFLNSPRPDRICGQEGYAYILSEYIQPQCGSCHSAGGLFAPYIAGPEPSGAWVSAARIDPDVFRRNVINNPFCGENCSLSLGGETLDAVDEWLEYPTDCP